MAIQEKFKELGLGEARKTEKRMDQNRSYHVSDMGTGTCLVLTGTPINEVPADSSRVPVHLWRTRTALKKSRSEVKERSNEESRQRERTFSDPGDGGTTKVLDG